MSEQQDIEAPDEQLPPLINNIPGVFGVVFEPISESSQVGNNEENGPNLKSKEMQSSPALID